MVWLPLPSEKKTNEGGAMCGVITINIILPRPRESYQVFPRGLKKCARKYKTSPSSSRNKKETKQECSFLGQVRTATTYYSLWCTPPYGNYEMTAWKKWKGGIAIYVLVLQVTAVRKTNTAVCTGTYCCSISGTRYCCIEKTSPVHK